MNLSQLLAPVFERYQLPDAETLAHGPLSVVAAKVRGSIKSRTKILKAELDTSHAAALETLARALDFPNWFELNRILNAMEAEPPRVPSPEAANRLLSVLVTWPGPPETTGAQTRAAMANSHLAVHVVIAHMHGHKLASVLQIPLPRALNLSAKLHGASDWDALVYDTPYWVAIGRGTPGR